MNYLKKILLTGEAVVHRAPPHRVILVPRALLIGVALGWFIVEIAGISWDHLEAELPGLRFFIPIVLGTVVCSILAEWLYLTSEFIVTNQRIIVVTSGLMGRKARGIPLESIRKVVFDRRKLTPFLDLGDLIVWVDTGRRYRCSNLDRPMDFRQAVLEQIDQVRQRLSAKDPRSHPISPL
ncbi:MAG: PH domain-containing protein [Planctomycetota bacterium]|nr:PH domain-containing protein [Planctomycetota bacterium]